MVRRLFWLGFILTVQALFQACNDLLHGCIYKSKCIMYKDIKLFCLQKNFL